MNQSFGVKLYITKKPESRVTAFIGVKYALEFFNNYGDEARLLDATQNIIENIDRDGFSFVGESNTESELAILCTTLAERGFETELDMDTVKAHTRKWSKRLTTDGATPEEVFAMRGGSLPENPIVPASVTAIPSEIHRTALVMMARSQGNPLNACADCIAIMRVSEGQRSFFGQVVEYYESCFPWLNEMLVTQKLRPLPS